MLNPLPKVQASHRILSHTNIRKFAVVSFNIDFRNALRDIVENMNTMTPSRCLHIYNWHQVVAGHWGWPLLGSGHAEMKKA